MNNVLEIGLVIGVIAYVVGRQLIGEPLQGRRLIILPVALVGVGVYSLSKQVHAIVTVDYVFMGLSALVSAVVGVLQGRMMQLERRNGMLWGKMPVRSLWLWGALIAGRLVIGVLAAGADAHIAASTAPLLLTLGINRLAQAAVIAPKALAAGVPFAPDSKGRTVLSGFAKPEHEQRDLKDTDWKSAVQHVITQLRR